jgi:uncharacterized protein YheU (UPF0270 family)
MAIIKTLKFLNGIVSEIDSTNDTLAVKSLTVGGTAGTELTKIKLDSLVSGVADASNLHNHDVLYFNKDEHLDESSGPSDAGKPVILNIEGKLDSSMLEPTTGFKKESFILTPANISNGYVVLAMQPIQDSLDLIVHGVVMNEGVDFEIQEVAGETRVVFIGQLAASGDAALEANELIRVKYAVLE